MLSHIEISAWEQEERHAILRMKLLRRTADATVIVCHDCGTPHMAEVVRDASRPSFSYYICPQIGRVALAEEATHQWEVDFDRFAALIRDGIGLGGRAATLIAGRLWLLGRQQLDDGFRELFLVRGLAWPDGPDLLDQCIRLQQSPTPILLVPRKLPSAQVLGQRTWVVRSLSELAAIDGAKLAIDAQAFGLAPRPGSMLALQGVVAKRLPRSIGTPAAVNAAVRYMEARGLTETQFGNQFQSTDRTVRSFRKSGKMRRSTFEAMAKSMGLSIEQLLRGETPKSDRR